MTKREEFEVALNVLVMAVREHAPEMGHGPKAQARARVLALYDDKTTTPDYKAARAVYLDHRNALCPPAPIKTARAIVDAALKVKP